MDGWMDGLLGLVGMCYREHMTADPPSSHPHAKIQVPGSILIGIIAITAIVWGLEGSGPTVIAQVRRSNPIPSHPVDRHTEHQPTSLASIYNLTPRPSDTQHQTPPTNNASHLYNRTPQPPNQMPKFDLSIAEGLDFSTTFSMEMVSAVLAFIFVGACRTRPTYPNQNSRTIPRSHSPAPTLPTPHTLPTGIFDISGVMFGMGRLAKLTQPDETIPGSIWAFLASAIGSVVGGLTGSTPVIVQVGRCTSYF